MRQIPSCRSRLASRSSAPGGTGHTIWDVDPVAKTYSVWLDNLPEPQQMALSEDGQMLFVTQATNPGDVLGIDVMTKATIFDYATLNPSTPLNQPTGVAVGSGNPRCFPRPRRPN